MIPGEFAGFQYLPSENQISFPVNYNNNLRLNSNLPAAFNFDRVLNNLHITPFLQQPSSLSNNSTSDEAEDNQLSIIDERKQRRMISNRESARRSRMRKQKHLDELWSQVVRLRNENHNLMDKLNHISESHDRVLKENAQLKEEASDLRQLIADLEIGSPYTANALHNLEEIVCDVDFLRANSSSQSSPIL